jgi:Ala-tRNA(Pro) deacylase
VLDSALLENELVNGHPLSNDQTTTIASADLIRFLEATGHTPLVLKVSE